MSQKFRRNPKIESAPLSDDAILLDPDKPQFFLLNETSASFWAYLAVASTAEELATQICKDFDGVELTEARQDAEKVLKEMLMQGLIETNELIETNDESVDTRRDGDGQRRQPR